MPIHAGFLCKMGNRVGSLELTGVRKRCALQKEYDHRPRLHKDQLEELGPDNVADKGDRAYTLG